MAWNKPSTWFGKPTPEPTPTNQYSSPIGPQEPQSPANLPPAFRPAPNPFAPPTSPATSTPKTSGGGGGGSSGGGGGGSSTAPLSGPVYDSSGKLVGVADPIKQQTVISPLAPSKARTTAVQVAEAKPVTSSVQTKPLGVVAPAPTITEKYKRTTAEQGYIKGTIAFGSDYFANFFAGSKYSPVKETGYEQPIRKLFKTTGSVGPYFTPVGSALLVGGGIEEVGTKAGRARIGERATYFEEVKGYSPFTSKTIFYGLPVAEVGLGLVGVRSQFKGIQATQQAKLFESTPQVVSGYRFEGAKGGADILKASKQTSPNVFQRIIGIKPTRYTSEVTQPFYKVSDTKVILEGNCFWK